ncbi:MAG: hypothetical protein IJZ78_02670 [Alistipes sp.]|nr:hypothetical protein [Alistipes sp.]
MKLLTVLVNNRIDHTINFDRISSTPNSYIAQIGAGGRVNLLRFPGGDTCTIHTDTADETRKITNIFYRVISETPVGIYTEVCAEFIIRLGNQTNRRGYGHNNTPKHNNNNQNALPDGAIDVLSTQTLQYWQNGCLFLPVRDRHTYSVAIKFEVDGYEINDFASIQINAAQQQRIWDVVLDYGSEASQLIVSRRDDQNVNDLSTLFDEFFKTLNDDTTPAANDPTLYVQYDSDSERYYKSVFYIKREFPVDLQNSPDGFRLDVTKLLGKDRDILLLNRYNQMEVYRDMYMAVPNLKIANHRGVFLPTIDVGGINLTAPKIGDNDVYRKIINAFMQIALKNTRLDGAARFLNIVLLVPNTYVQSDVTRVLTHLSADIMTLVKNNPDTFGNVKGVEVSSISESDASFVGVMEHMSDQIPAGGRYLIMDAGKGTLDFSVIKDSINGNNNYRYNSIFRSGIIGAGNAISYAILLSILNHIFSSEQNKDKREAKIEAFVVKYILDPSADLAEITALMKLVEDYKRLYNNGNLRNPQVIDGANVTSLEGMNDLIKKMVDNKILVNDESYINNMIDNICLSASNKLSKSYPTGEEFKIDHIIFAGRGFLMNKLRKRMEEILKQQNPTICSGAVMHDLIHISEKDTAVTPKNVCMFIINGIRAGLYNGRIIGIPRISHTDAKQDKPNNDNNTQSTDGGTQQSKVTDFFKPVVEFFAQFKNDENNLFGRIWNVIAPFSNNQVNEQQSRITAISSTPRDLASGYKDVITNQTDKMIVSGTEYTFGANQLNTRGNVMVKLFFDGSDFVIRKDGHNGGIIETICSRDLDGDFVFESTFPFLLVQPGLNNHIPFPTRREVVPVEQPRRGNDTPTPNRDAEDEQQLRKIV